MDGTQCRFPHASMLAASTLSAATALAQGAATTPVSTEPEPLEEVTVTSYRSSIEESLDQKREANAFVDVINAEDVGKFPDKNVADSLQRVPGIVITRDGGEGSRVSIRGLQADLTLTQLNGNYIASADSLDPSRSFNYILLPSNMIASIEVFKSPEARIDEGGVGGTVILRTREPLDLPAWSGFLSAEGTDSDTTREIDPQISGQISWKNQAETVGLLAGATSQKRTNREMRASTETWRWWTDSRETQPATEVNGNTYANDDAISYWWGTGTTTLDGQHYSGYWAPQSVNQSILNQERERIGIQATAQWKPADKLKLTANYFRFELEGDYTSNVLKIPEWGFGSFFTGAKFDPSGTVLQSATFDVPAGYANTSQTMETPQLSGEYSREEAVSNTFDLGGAWEGATRDLSFKLGRTRATGGPSMRFNMAAKPRFTTTDAAGNAIGANGNVFSQWSFGNSVNMVFSPQLQQSLMNGIAQVDTGSTGSTYINSSIEQTYAQIDGSQRYERFIRSLQAGLKYRDAKIHRETGRTEWYADDAQQLRYQDSAQGALALPSFFFARPIGNIPGGFTTSSYPGIDFQSYLNYLNATFNGPHDVDETEFVYDIGEEIWSGYVQANFETKRLRGNLGVRVARTKQFGESTDRLTYLLNYYQDGPEGPLGPPAICPAGGVTTEGVQCAPGLPVVIPQDQRENIVNQVTSQTKSYTEFLPSFNLSYNIADDLLLRAAVARVLARPGYEDLGSQQQLTNRSAAWEADRLQFGERQGWSGEGGNRELEPFIAWQYDAGIEWYFHPGSVVGATLFRKEVSNFVVPLVIDINRVVDGQTVLVQPYATVANGSDAVSEGIEIYTQHTLAFGLGLQANFTYNDTSVTDISLEGQVIGSSPLVGSAKTQINGSIFYETDRLLLRASYNRRGEQVEGLQSGLNVYSEPYEQIDLNASVNLRNDLVVTASVINLTESEQRQHLGNDTDARFYSNLYSGRRAYLGLTYSF
jgi:iron complex outermembrane recepter protein